ncbi:MAG: hypothetical protein RLN97_09960 [Fulvivirga sp.]
MSSKTRSILKLVAILVVVLCVLMKMSIIIIPVLVPHMFWMVVIAFGLLFISGK